MAKTDDEEDDVEEDDVGEEEDDIFKMVSSSERSMAVPAPLPPVETLTHRPTTPLTSANRDGH